MKLFKTLGVLFAALFLFATQAAAFTNSGYYLRPRSQVNPYFFGDIKLLDPDVAHGLTGLFRTDAYGFDTISNATDGGRHIYGASDAAGQTALSLVGIFGSTDPTDTVGALRLIGAKRSGIGAADLGAAETVLQIYNNNTLLGTFLGGGNYGFNTASFGTSAAKTMGFAQWTQPTTSPADVAQVGAADWGGVAGKTRLHTRTEEGQVDALATINETAIYYGVTWDESADSYTRTGRTTGHKVAASLPDSMLPIQKMMQRVILTDAGTVAYALGASDSTKKIDGSTASVLTGADGQVMVRIPKFWYRYLYVGTTHTWEVSPVAMSGFEPHPAFYKDGAWVDYRYIGAYEGVLYDTSITAYVDGIYQTAVSTVFDTTDDSITIATRSNWATNLTVGQKLVITGTTSNNATLTVASLVDGTKITVSENLINETAASTVIQTQKDFTATTGDKLSSVSGKAAINYLTRANARAIALNRGAGWRQIDYDLMSAIQLLFLTEYASFYSQSVLGAGITAVIDWAAYNDSNPIARSGNSNSIGNASGNTAGATSAATESTKYLTYRGIENWFGHLWKFVDGFNINGNIPYRTNVGTNFADDTTTNYTQLVNILNNNVTLHNADGYPATIQKVENGFLAASVGASSSTKITDYYYQAAGWRVALFGAASANGAAAGGFCWYLSNESGDLVTSVVARLAF